MVDDGADRGAISFGPYVLRANLRLLERDGLAVQLGDRAFDILCVLVERAGEIVSNRELIARVWGKVVVGEGSVRFHINALRKALAGRTAFAGCTALAHEGAPQYIKNVTRRGYTFIAPVRKAASDPRRLPRRPMEIIGRAGQIKEIAELLAQFRFVTLVGFVDLDAIKDPAWVARAVAAAAGLAGRRDLSQRRRHSPGHRAGRRARGHAGAVRLDLSRVRDGGGET